jgi:hypothetical protein
MATVLIGIHMLYDTIRLMFVAELRGDLMFWLQPVLMLIGPAAVWRIGSVLNAQAVSERYAQGKPGCLRWTCMLVCAIPLRMAHEIAGAACTRLSLRPLFLWRAKA